MLLQEVYGQLLEPFGDIRKKGTWIYWIPFNIEPRNRILLQDAYGKLQEPFGDTRKKGT